MGEGERDQDQDHDKDQDLWGGERRAGARQLGIRNVSIWELEGGGGEIRRENKQRSFQSLDPATPEQDRFAKRIFF